MSPLGILLLLAALLFPFAILWLDKLPPGDATTLIRIRSGNIQHVRGKVSALAREHVLDILSEANVVTGFIAINAQKRVTFSRNIPSGIHQKLRNVLLNQ